MVINGQTVTNDFTVTTKATVVGSSDIDPSSASPVLKTRLTITIDDDFPFPDAEASQFTVNATSVDDSTYIRYLSVLSLDFTDDAKTMEVMFGGAYTGVFDIAIRHSEYGLLNTAGM